MKYVFLVQIRTIDDEAIPLLVKGHQLKMYKIPLSKQDFVDDINNTVMIVEQVPTPPSSNHLGESKRTQVKMYMRCLSPIFGLKTSLRQPNYFSKKKKIIIKFPFSSGREG